MPPSMIRSTARVAGLAAGLLMAAARASAESADSAASAAAIERALIGAGFENVTVEAGETTKVAFENRRLRHSVEALGLVHSLAGRNVLAFERRLGMVAAAIETAGPDSAPEFRLRYPSDPSFLGPPAGPRRSATFTRADLNFGILLDYRIGQLFNPLELRVELEPRLRLNPWPGAAVQLGILLPIENDYPAGELDRGAGQVRPGRCSIDQFFWLPQVALASVSAGYFGDNRYGAAIGLATPLRQGEFVLDAQYEQTGFVAFDEGTYYSSPEVRSGWAGVSYRPGFADVTVRARAAQFLYGDRGGEVEVSRRFADLEIAYFAQRSLGQQTYGIRLDLPIPPRVRSSGSRLRVQPVPRFGLSFRDESTPIATLLTGVASREDHLRQLSEPGLETQRERYGDAIPGAPDRPARPPGEGDWVSMSGMTGFIHTPWAGTLRDRSFEAGFNFIPRKWAYDHRGTSDNEVYYGTLGFLPRVETCMRWTRIPGYRSFEEIVPDSRLVDIDRMSSGRVEVLTPRPNRPGLAVGMEDVQGTRRFHSAYAVSGMPLRILGMAGRAALGYGLNTFAADRYVLDGVFGAIEIVPTTYARVQAEHDTEKWNLGLGLSPGAGFHIRAALLNLESLALGVGWAHRL